MTRPHLDYEASFYNNATKPNHEALFYNNMIEPNHKHS